VSECSKLRRYSITSSANNCREFGTSMPSALDFRQVQLFQLAPAGTIGTDLPVGLFRLRPDGVRQFGLLAMRTKAASSRLKRGASS
jgi:hypothetical protein